MIRPSSQIESPPIRPYQIRIWLSSPHIHTRQLKGSGRSLAAFALLMKYAELVHYAGRLMQLAAHELCTVVLFSAEKSPFAADAINRARHAIAGFSCCANLMGIVLKWLGLIDGFVMGGLMMMTWVIGLNNQRKF